MHRRALSRGKRARVEDLPARTGFATLPGVRRSRARTSCPAFSSSSRQKEFFVSHQFVCTLYKLKKVVPPDRVILDDITLAFLPGAKIGVLGHNGAGKSTLLRIMAGVDKEFLGEAKPADGVRVGFLPQEPRLDAGKTVLENVEAAVMATRNLLKRFEEIGVLLGESPDNMDELLEEYGV